MNRTTAKSGALVGAASGREYFRQRYLSICALAVVATALMGPELFTGLTVTDSFRFNLIWPEQFAELFRQGHLYPRWLPLSWDGLGSPAFYFYPPLFFWVAALVDTLTGGAVPAERFVPIASLIVLYASGLAMRAWLRVQVTEQRARLGAIAYMVAPYHLYDIYARGALAEATAYACAPIVMLALARLAQGRVRYLPLLSAGYAALLFSHLPSALLVTIFMVAPYTVFLAAHAQDQLRFLLRALVGGLTGIGLAAIYLVPALGLLQFVSPGALSSEFYRPENWFFWHFYPGPMGARMAFLIPVGISALLLAAAAVLAVRRSAGSREPLFWGAITIVTVFIIAGAIPALWKLPGLVLVQFPWRALTCVEFALITLLAICLPSFTRAVAFGGLVVLAFAYAVLGLYIQYTVARTAHGLTASAVAIRVHYRDATEYLPAGTRIVLGAGPDENQVDLPELHGASGPGADITAVASPDGGLAIDVQSPIPVHVKLPRFYFPHWRLINAHGRTVPIQPEPGERVVTFEAPSGRSIFHLEPGTAPYERLGRSTSLLALLLVLALGGLAERHARQSSLRGARHDGGRGRV